MLLPPWPYNFKLGGVAPNYRIHRPAWSPDGTQIACRSDFNIIIFDQRHGPLRFRHNEDNTSNIKTMLDRDPIQIGTDIHLLYSPDGSFLVALTAHFRVKVLRLGLELGLNNSYYYYYYHYYYFQSNPSKNKRK